MTTPTALGERLEQLGKPVDERPALLLVRAPLATVEEREAWIGLRAAPPPFVRRITIKLAGADFDLEPEPAPNLGDLFQITIEKQVPPGEMRLFFAESIAGMEAELAIATRVRVARMAPEESFDTYLARFEPWDDNQAAADEFAPHSPLSDPREFARDLTGAATVPGDLRPWLRRSEPVTSGDTYATWLRLAGRRVFAALADQVTKNTGGDLIYGFTGPPRRTILLTTVNTGDEAPLAECLQKAGQWVYAQGTDAETRHLLLSSEWARTYNPHIAEPLQEVCKQALESADVAYGAYVRRESRETLEALAGLREAVVEETQKTRERAQDLASALWKDLAVASAPFVLKILSDAGKVSGKIAAGLAFAAAAFLVFSFAMQVYINNRFFAHQNDSRTKWQEVLGRMLLTPNEVNEISVEPITRSMTTYYRVRFAIGIIYLALVAALIAFGNAMPASSGTPPQPPTPHADTSVRMPARDRRDNNAAKQIRLPGADTGERQRPARASAAGVDTSKK